MIKGSLCPEGHLSCYKTRRIVTYFYIDCPNTQLIFTHVRFVDLLSSCPRSQSFDSTGDEDTTLLNVAEILGTKDLEFSVFFDKVVDEGSIVVERCPEDGIEHDCDLRRG